MSIEFHEPTTTKETLIGVELEIVAPAENHNWAIALNTENPKDLEALDHAIDNILHLEMTMPHFDTERSTATHHVWELGERSLLNEKEEDIRDYLSDIINRTKKTTEAQRINYS